MIINYKSFICNIFISILSLFLILLFLEISIRVSLYFKNQKNFEEVMSNLPELKPNVPANLADIIRPSKYPGIIYELRPNVKASFMNVQIETNNEGWRGKLCPIHKDKNTIRIVTIGDSHMFGWGVSEDKRYTNILENMLNLKFPEKRWEIINTAVPGYNTYMEVETLKRKALIYKPDIVIMEYIGNDLELPNFIMNNTDYLNFRKSFLLVFLKGKIKLLDTKLNLIAIPMITDAITGRLRFSGENEINMVPEKYRYLVGWNSFAKSMLKLKKMQQAYNFDVIIRISHNWPKTMPLKIIKLCNQFKFYVLYSPQKHKPPSLILSNEDEHPSVLGHKLIAEGFFDYIVKEKIINKYIEKQ